MILHLWCDSTHQPSEAIGANEGWSAAMTLWESLERSGKVQCEEMDTANFSHEQRRRAYEETALVASVWRHYKVSKVFWKGRAFGGIIPALVVYETDEKRRPDVYPRLKRGKDVTILACLTRLLAELGLED